MTTSPWIYPFAVGDPAWHDLLGGTGAGLTEITQAGIPVPSGFTITTAACRFTLAHDGDWPDGLWDEIVAHLAGIETATGRRFGDAAAPLLLSVRSGAAISMPGMMETILNLGLDDAAVAGLGVQAGDDRFAWDSFRRLIQMYSRVVLGVSSDRFESRLAAHKRLVGVEHQFATTMVRNGVRDTHLSMLMGHEDQQHHQTIHPLG